MQEEVDLSAYAGKKVLVRFEYVSDDATSLTGMAVDNIEIPEIGFRDGVDSEAAVESEGFKRIERPMEQQFIVQEIAGDRRARGAGRVNRGSVARRQRDDRVSGATDGPAVVVALRWSLAP